MDGPIVFSDPSGSLQNDSGNPVVLFGCPLSDVNTLNSDSSLASHSLFQEIQIVA